MAVANVPASGRVMDVIASAWRDAYPLMQSRIKVYYVLIAIGTVLALLGALASGGVDNGSASSGSIVNIIASFYALSAAIRTVRPEFHWTATRVLMVIVWSLVVGILTSIGLAIFVLPGIFIGVRLCMTYYAYLMPEGDANPLAESWHLTARHFWSTLGLIVLVVIISGVVSVLVSLVLGVLGHISPWLEAVLMIPGLYVQFLLINFAVLANVRWFVFLRQSRSLTAVPVPA